MLAMLMVLCYTVCRCVGTVRSTCHRGVITFRSICKQLHAGSSPVIRTTKRPANRAFCFTFSKPISECGEIGRRARFRFWWISVQVQVLSLAPWRVFLQHLKCCRTLAFFISQFALQQTTCLRYGRSLFFSEDLHLLYSRCLTAICFLQSNPF